jgi:MFS superfamily sulfate permease-like transporter
MENKRRGRFAWLGGTVVLLVLGVIFGLILQNVWLGIAIAVFVSLIWLIAVESRRGGNQGVNDESHGQEV